MKFIRSIPVTNTMFTSSNIVETPPAAYSAGATYNTGDQVSVFTGTLATMYQSLADGNIGNIPASSPTVWQPIGTTYSAYSGATSYATGARVVSTATHRVYESLVNANLGNALTDTTKWLDIGPTNKWALFDQVNGTITTHPLQMDITLTVTGRVDTMAFISLDNVTSIQVIVNTAADGEIYNMTFGTVSTINITNWHDYFFEDIIQKDALLIPDLPIDADPVIRVILTGSGTADMSIGSLVFGRAKFIGNTLRDGASVGITDYSRKDVDDFGNYVIIQRAFAKRGSFRVSMTKAMVDDVHASLSEYRAIPTVYSASDEFSSTLIFGFYKDFNIGFEYPLTSYCNIEIEGLT